jgi:hypothetical protein
MRTPSHIASLAAIAFAVPILLSQVQTLGVLTALLGGIGAGVLVWAGTYVGARWAAPHQRTVRLAWVLGILFFIIGVALTIPIKTHAVLLDMPPPNGSASPLDFIRPLVAYIEAPLVMVVGSLLLTRGVATICGRPIA